MIVEGSAGETLELRATQGDSNEVRSGAQYLEHIEPAHRGRMTYA